MKKTLAIIAMLTILVLLIGCAKEVSEKAEDTAPATATDNEVSDIEGEFTAIDDLMDSDMGELESLENELAELDALEFE